MASSKKSGYFKVGREGWRHHQETNGPAGLSMGGRNAPGAERREEQTHARYPGVRDSHWKDKFP